MSLNTIVMVLAVKQDTEQKASSNGKEKESDAVT